ncbi:MAG: FAD-dependent oxidoreductase, partial [Oscillospiraceae bacterium]|nr:FAD-dependent oxidoreductase [Candidatus Equicaccousia limihippi]
TAAKDRQKVAVVGSGPAGLSCAGELAKKGYDVTVFEALHKAGGVLSYGIPEFRLPKAVVQNTVKDLENMGVTFKTDFVIGKTQTVDELFEEGFSAVFIGTGAGLPKFLGVKGETLCGVFSANEYLTRINLMKAYKEGAKTPIPRGGTVAVVGGGNVAMDAARCALRLNADKVYILYRRSEKELPARAEEVLHAKEEGIIFEFLCDPIEIIGDTNGNVKAVKCQKTELSEPDESGRRRPVAVPDSEYEIAANTVIMALGTSPNPLVRSTTSGLECDQRGRIVVGENTTATAKEGVFAGGDTVTGSATVILAMGAGKKAANEIDEYLLKL